MLGLTEFDCIITLNIIIILYGVGATRVSCRSSTSGAKKYKRAFYDPGTGTVYFQWVPRFKTPFFTIDVYVGFSRRILGQRDGSRQNRVFRRQTRWQAEQRQSSGELQPCTLSVYLTIIISTKRNKIINIVAEFFPEQYRALLRILLRWRL